MFCDLCSRQAFDDPKIDDFTFGRITATTGQESPTFELRMQNREHPTTGSDYHWSSLISTDLNGVRVTVRLVMASNLADTTSQIAEPDWRITRPRLDGDEAVFTVGPPHDIYRLETPWPRLKQARCTHEYKDGGCASQSSKTTCPSKTVQECMARHSQNALRISQLPIHDRSLYRRAR